MRRLTPGELGVGATATRRRYDTRRIIGVPSPDVMGRQPRKVAARVPSDPEARAALKAAVSALRAAASGLEQIHTPLPNVDVWQSALAELGIRLGTVRRRTAEVSGLLELGSAQDRLLQYLRGRVGQVVQGDELAGVAGISAWARRVRELRVEHGWPIESRIQRPGLAADEYVLVDDGPSEALAEAWRLAKRVRGMTALSGKNRALEYLKAISPGPADQDQLSYVAKIKSWQRRMRELDEEGWDIRSNIDEPTLPPGTYRLASLTRRPPRAREAIKLRYRILERDKYTCQDCGAQRGDTNVRLQVHHVLPVHQHGTNVETNLLTLCSGCHAGRHAVAGIKNTADELLEPDKELPIVTD